MPVPRAPSPGDGLFSAINPTFQQFWDPTSARVLMECPEKYHLRQVEGWHAPGESVHLEFGRAAGEGLEKFHRAIIEEGADHEHALRLGMRAALEASWDSVAGKPKLGTYEAVWRCQGTTKFKNKAGNAAKCPYSHKGKLFPAPGPDICSCGSPTTHSTEWFPTLAGKDRFALMRLLVWYGEEIKGGALQPVSITHRVETPLNPPSPTFEGPEPYVEQHVALVEVPFKVPFISTPDGEQVYLTGWFDAVKRLGDEVLVTDYKTTKKPLGTMYFSQYAPNPQVDIYDLVADGFLKAKGLPYAGVVIEAIQTLVNGVRFGFRVYKNGPENRNELTRELSYYISMAWQYAKGGWWPKNRSHCAMCEFKGVCSAAPASRPHILAGNFKRYRWNPLTRQQEPL